MTKRFRMVAGPNGSGKSTLTAWLMRDYAVNFYTMLNADDGLLLLLRCAAVGTGPACRGSFCRPLAIFGGI